MSYDLELWTKRKPRLGEQLKEFGGKRNEECYAIEVKDANIYIFEATEVEEEDLPEELQGKKSLKYMTSMGMEGSGAKAFALLKKVCKKLAAANEGFVVDMQKSPPGGKKKPEPSPEFSVTELSFNTTWRGMGEAAFAEAFLGLLEKHIPEAVPDRYGPHSPPPHKYERTGQKHLVQFLSAPREKYGSHVNWQCKLPVIFVHYYIPMPWAWQEFKAYGGHRYNTGCFQIQLMADKYPPNSPRIKQFWTDCNSLMRCFYSEIRFLRNRAFSTPKRPYDGLVHVSDPANQSRSSAFWEGPPAPLAGAVFLSARYVWSWPVFWLRSKRIGRGWVVDCLNEKENYSAASRIGNIPAYLRMKPDGHYPSVFPFESPF